MNKIVKSNKYVITDHLIQSALHNDLTVIDFVILTYLDNNYNNIFNPDEIGKHLNLSPEQIFMSIEKLMSKKIISIDIEINDNNKKIETYQLTGLYEIKEQKQNNEEQTKKPIIEQKPIQKEINIYEEFEIAFAKPLTPIEVEIIKSWLNKNISIELIKGALDEAKYNNVTNIRYIDKILTDWQSKKYKTMEDVKTPKTKKQDDKILNLFDYDWTLDDEY